MSETAPRITRQDALTAKITFPNSLEKVATARQDDTMVNVEPQTEKRLDARAARAWGAYYTAAADILDQVNAVNVVGPR